MSFCNSKVIHRKPTKNLQNAIKSSGRSIVTPSRQGGIIAPFRRGIAGIVRKQKAYFDSRTNDESLLKATGPFPGIFELRSSCVVQAPCKGTIFVRSTMFVPLLTDVIWANWFVELASTVTLIFT